MLYFWFQESVRGREVVLVCSKGDKSQIIYCLPLYSRLTKGVVTTPLTVFHGAQEQDTDRHVLTPSELLSQHLHTNLNKNSCHVQIKGMNNKD